jgi:uncharacterized protein (DUF697 family)
MSGTKYEVDRQAVLAATQIKAVYPIAYADAFIIATAQSQMASS